MQLVVYLNMFLKGIWVSLKSLRIHHNCLSNIFGIILIGRKKNKEEINDLLPKDFKHISDLVSPAT